MADHIREIERLLGRNLTEEEVRLLHLAKKVEEGMTRHEPPRQLGHPAFEATG